MAAKWLLRSAGPDIRRGAGLVGVYAAYAYLAFLGVNRVAALADDVGRTPEGDGLGGWRFARWRAGACGGEGCRSEEEGGEYWED